MLTTHLIFGWLWISAGLGVGAVLGLGFDKDKFLGGYDSWRRRLARLGHIAFFGTGWLNLMFAMTLDMTEATGPIVEFASTSLIIGAVLMPLVCMLSSWKKPMRVFFPVPAGALILGCCATAWFLMGL